MMYNRPRCKFDLAKRRQSCCQMMHIAHFYGWLLTWIMGKLLKPASFHTPTSVRSSSLVSQLLFISWVDFTSTPELNSGCFFVLNENRGHCRVLSSTQPFFSFFSAFVCLITLMWKKNMTNLVKLCALCDPHLNQALFNNGTLKWKAYSVTCFWSKWSHFLGSSCSKKVLF